MSDEYEVVWSTAKRLIVATCVLCTFGCTADPLRTVEGENPGVKVELITSFDGIRLYRVFDGSGGDPIYVADGRGGTRVSWNTTITTTQQVGDVPVTTTHTNRHQTELVK